MRKAYINTPKSEKLAASTYAYEIVYDNGNILRDSQVGYSYSDVFEIIKMKHENENDRKVLRINIELVN